MISEQGLGFARHEVERRLYQCGYETTRRATEALERFKAHSVDLETIMWLLAEELLRVEGAKTRFKNEAALVAGARLHLSHVKGIRSLFDAMFDAALESHERGIADRTLPPGEVFIGLEDVRAFLQAYPELNREARELWGIASEHADRVDDTRRGSIGNFAFEMHRRVGKSFDQHVANLIGPTVGWSFLEPRTVRNCLDGFRRKFRLIVWL